MDSVVMRNIEKFIKKMIVSKVMSWMWLILLVRGFFQRMKTKTAILNNNCKRMLRRGIFSVQTEIIIGTAILMV